MTGFGEKRTVSSAYSRSQRGDEAENGLGSSSNLLVYSSSTSCIRHESTIMKRYGERGQPCLMPLVEGGGRRGQSHS